ncbi:MAG TPA: protein kinase [Terriglobales bacterium]|nr:protein kinase [Terriglobales bacterium]
MAISKPTTLGKYDILEVIGRGGMGVVYKAIDRALGRLVAIKMMTVGSADDPELLKRFYREAQSAGKLQHPNIVTIYDLGDQDGNPYMVMEFLAGESLASMISARRTIPLDQKLHILIQICSALGYAHQRGVVHRDIKPANAMVLKDMTVKIVDFGIARIGNERVTRPGQLMGSIQYMSPEQISASHVDARTDIFSVGVLLYQLLTYALPFDGKDNGAVLLKIIHEPPPPLSAYLSTYPEELDRIVARALAKKREERYATADDLEFDLTRIREELKREKVSEYVKSIEDLIANSQWNQAKEHISNILKIDRQNTYAKDLLRTIQQRIQAQQRSEQARELRLQAEQAIAREELGDALRYLEQAVELDSDSRDLLQLRDAIAERKARADQCAALLQQAESARDSGGLEEAHKAVAEALAIDSDNREAKALNAIIMRELAEESQLKETQTYLDEARKRIASRSFTAALEMLKKAEILSPNVPGIKELADLAVSGREQEKRRKQLERLNEEIVDALNSDDFALACSKATEGLLIFPQDRSLLKLKNLAEKQREAREKRAYVEGQIACARQLLNSANPDQSLLPIQEALKKYPQEPALLSMLSVVTETLDRLRVERNKAEYVQRAKDAMRRKEYNEAIEILNEGRKKIVSSDLDDLLQFAQEEALNNVTRKKIDAVAEQAHQLISAHQYQRAIDILESALRDHCEDELTIILSDARRRLLEFNQQIRDAVATAKRLLRNDRYGEAVRFLEGQCEQCGESPELTTCLQQARNQLIRVQTFSATKESVREALALNDFERASKILWGFRERFGDSADTGCLQQEIEAARSRMATAAMQRALSDVRVLLMARSFESAEGILHTVAEWTRYVTAALREQYESLRLLTSQAKTKYAAGERAQKLNQASMAEQLTASVENHEDEAAAKSEINPTDAMGRSQLEAILAQVSQIADHYADNQRVQSAIGDLKQKLTSRIATFEQETVSASVPKVDMGHAAPLLHSNNQAPAAATRSQKMVAWSEETLRTVDKQLAAFIGPMARILVKRAASRAADLDELYSLLAASLDREADRQAFLSRRIGASQSSTRTVSPPGATQISGLPVPVCPELTPAALEHAARLLARHVGPIAAILVSKEAPRAQSLHSLYLFLAEHVEPGTDRARFLREAGFDCQSPSGPKSQAS